VGKARRFVGGSSAVLLLLITCGGEAALRESSLAGPSAIERIVVGEDRPVDIGDLGHPLIEPHLTVHPENPNHLLGGVMVMPAERGVAEAEAYCAAILSEDAGESWRIVHRTRTSRFCHDPWVAINRGNTALFATLSSVEPVEVFVLRSDDAGRSWREEPVALGGGHDHPVMAVDNTSGPHADDIYLLTNRVRRRDSEEIRAETHAQWRYASHVTRFDASQGAFEAPRHHFLSVLNQNTLNPVVLSDGTLVFVHSDFMRRQIYRDAQTGNPRARFVFLENRRTSAVRSTDGGTTISPPLFITEECGIEGATWPVLAADRSGGDFQDRLYLICGRDGDFNGLQLFTSDLFGEVWTDPVRIDRDPHAGAPPHTRTQQIAVNKDGVVGVTWLDGRSDPDRRCFDVYFTASLDGGESFLPEVKVSSESSCAADGTNGWVAERWPSGGDYSGFVAAADGRFHIVWPDSRSGRFRLRHTAVTVDAGAERSGGS